MNSSAKNTRAILKNYQISPAKRLGQNFLIDKTAINKIIQTAEIKPTDNILEIGPGTGALTEKLSQKAKKVTAIEKDIEIVKLLKKSLPKKNIEIISGDALKMIDSFYRLTFGSAEKQKEKEYKLIANLPYYITSHLIRKVLESKDPPKEATLVVQKEVGQRICAQPPKMSLLAVSVQFYATTALIGFISKDSFWPKPKVDSAIIKLTLKKERPIIDPDTFFKVVRAGFSQPRKRLANNLSKELKLSKEEIAKHFHRLAISPQERAESLRVDDWINLAKAFVSS